MVTHVYEELLGQLVDVLQHFVHVVLLLTDPRHLVGNELHESEGEKCKNTDVTSPHQILLAFGQKLTSSNRSVGLYGGPLSDTKPANAMPSSTFIRKSSSESVRWARKAAWGKRIRQQ